MGQDVAVTVACVTPKRVVRNEVQRQAASPVYVCIYCTQEGNMGFKANLFIYQQIFYEM